MARKHAADTTEYIDAQIAFYEAEMRPAARALDALEDAGHVDPMHPLYDTVHRCSDMLEALGTHRDML